MLSYFLHPGLKMITNRKNKQAAETTVPSDEDAQQINVVCPCKQHDHAKSQLEHEQPADDLVHPIVLAQCQEIQVVQVRGNIRNPCGSRSRAA